MTNAPPASLAFDDVLIDFAGRRLLRGGIEQSLEPKAFAVLALLASSPGRVFTRDEILDAGWGHRHGTPGVLNRIVTMLRQALGEDAHNARLLQTLHGVGYRFDLPIADESDALPPAAPDLHPAKSAEDERSGAPVDVGNHGSRTRWRYVLGAALLAAVAVGSWQLWQRTANGSAGLDISTSSVVARASPPTLMVMPLKPIGDVESTRIIAEGLGDELIGTLAQIEGLRVIASESTRRAAAETSDPAQLVQRLGITHTLEGSLQQVGQVLRVRLRLVVADKGDTLWARDFDRDANQVLGLQREIAQAVATSLALTMGLTEGPGSSSGDADYLSKYLAAMLLLRGEPSATLEAAEVAEASFRELIRQRPDDARARAGLLLALEIRSYRRMEIAEVLRKEMLEEATIVQRLDPTLPESWYIQAGSECRLNRLETCVALLEKASVLASSGSRTRIRKYYAYVMSQLGYLDIGETINREILASDPINPYRSFNLGRALDTQGRHEEALAYFDPVDPFQVYARWFNAVWRHDNAAALQIAEHDIGSDPQIDSKAVQLKPSYIAVSRALSDPNQWPQAMVEIEASEKEIGVWNFTRVLAPNASLSAGWFIGKIQGMRKRAYSSWDLLLWTKDLGWLRKDPAFQTYLRESGILDYWRKHGFPVQCRAAGDGAVCE